VGDHQLTGVPCRIGELADRHGLSVETLRYYEREGLLAPSRDEAGRRWYAEGDQLTLEIIIALRGVGFGIRDVAAMVSIKQPETPPERRVAAARARVRTMLEGVAQQRAACDRAEALLREWQAELDGYEED
jgi:DNA-binding transcriptional MerR regulator